MFRFIVLTVSVAACSARVNDFSPAAPLPDVDTILTAASSKAKKFSRQAGEMQREVAHQQEKSRYKIRNYREKYENLLTVQEKQTAAISRRVEALRTGNNNLHALNDALRANLTAMHVDNRHVRMTLQDLGDKVNTASLFVQDSVRATEGDDAAVLKVLNPKTESESPTVDSFLAFTGKHASLLQVVVPEAPENALVGALSESISAVEAAEQHAFEKLTRQFNISFAEGSRKQEALNTTEAELKETRTRLTDRYTKLLEAKAFLMRTRDALHDHIDALRQFAQKLGISAQSSVEAGEELRTVRKTRAPAPANISRSNAAPANATRLKANATTAIAASVFSAEVNATQQEQPRPATAALRSSKMSSFGSWIVDKLR